MEHVKFAWTRWAQDRRENIPYEEEGTVVAWVVVPGEGATGPYGEGPTSTYYTPSAIVKCKGGTFKVVPVDQLHVL